MASVVEREMWRKIPTLLDDDMLVRDWMDRHLDYTSPRRRWQTQAAALKLWNYLGRQWIVARTALAAHNGGYHFEDIHRESSAAFPQPVTNMIAPAVDNEVARLSKKEYTPDPSASKNKAEYIAAARLAKQILEYEMRRADWDSKREHLCFNLCIDAVAIAKTWWDENDLERTLIASPDAVKCPQCGRYFASPNVHLAMTQMSLPDEIMGGTPFKHTETLRELPSQPASGVVPPDPNVVQMQHCPYCDGLSMLQPFQMSPEEAQGNDAFGNPMGQEVMRGEPVIDVCSLHEYYPENGGLGTEPENQKVMSSIKVRSLEWIATRFPEFRDVAQPESPQKLLRYNPLYADRIFQGGGGGYGLGSGYEAYYNHARVFETIIQPMPIAGLEQGAWFIKVNDHMLRRPLCASIEVEGQEVLVPKAQYHFARFKRMPGNFWGRSFVDDMIPLQRRLNELDAQAIDLRERGKPSIWLPEGTELYTRDDVTGSLSLIHYDGVTPNWTPRDSIFPGIPLTGAVYSEERAQIIRDMQAIGFPQDIEMGQAPGVVKTTSGLMLLSEEASRKRAPREAALVRMYESIFEHYLQMLWAFRKEDANYEAQKEGGVYEIESYKGTDLLGDLRVQMVARVGYDQTLYNKEAASEALTLGLYKLDTPAAVDKILELMKLPKDVNENQTLQIARAEQAWSHFLDNRTVPNIDPTLYDPLTWYSVLGKRWHEDDAYIAQQECGWPMILPALTNWQQQLAETTAQEATSKPIYGKFPPEKWPQIQQQGNAMVAQAKQAFEQAQASFQKTGAPPPVPGAPPPHPPPTPPPMQQFPAPPPNGFLPEPLEQKIYTIFRRMTPDLDQGLAAAASAYQLRDSVKMAPEVNKILDLDSWLRMRAVIEAFRMMAGSGGAAPPTPGAQPIGAPPGPPPGQPTPGAIQQPPPQG